MSKFSSRFSSRSALWLSILLASLSLTCAETPGEVEPVEDPFYSGDGKGDLMDSSRSYEVLLTQPFCDTCTSADKDYLAANSAIVARVVELVDGAESSVDVAQFTFSDRVIEAALYRAKERGVRVRVAMDAGQDRAGSLSRRLAENGIDVRFVRGAEVSSQGRYGLMHSKFMIVDEHVLLSGSNNWSSTGTTINEENTIVMTSVAADPKIKAFACHFDSAWTKNPSASGECSTDDARFAPSGAPRVMIRDGIRAARDSVDVLMHHLLFNDLVKDLAQAAERGVRVRIIMNAEDRESYRGTNWDRFWAAGGEVRYKQNNPDAYQIMHHKLAIIDNRALLHGSGNWSGSGFFNNYEFYVRYRNPEVVRPFVDNFAHLWDWSLTPKSLDEGLNAALQHHAEHTVYFGNLHAHVHESGDDGKLFDDGELVRQEGGDGEFYRVDHELGERHVTRYAWEYARDLGGLDFMAISPHVVDDRDTDALNHPSMSVEAFEKLVDIARSVNRESGGNFVAIPSMEWNTNSAGNHVNIFGTDALAKVERDRFDLLYEDFLPGRVAQGERPILQFNHPRTFRQDEENLSGSWDQIFDINLLEIPRAAQRRQKFNDFGLDDYPPLKHVRDRWIEGEEMPSREIVRDTLYNIEEVTRPFLRLMEVTIGRGTDIAHEDRENPSMVERDGERVRYTRVESDWHYYLLHGFQMAPTANHDNHYANWGTGHSSRTAIIAPELTERALLGAIDRRLVYASEDENLAISLYADGRVPMGSQMATTGEQVTLSLYFEDPDYTGPFEAFVFLGRIGDDEVKLAVHLEDIEASKWLDIPVSVPATGDHFIYVELHEVDVERKAWTAPIWVTRH